VTSKQIKGTPTETKTKMNEDTIDVPLLMPEEREEIEVNNDSLLEYYITSKIQPGSGKLHLTSIIVIISL